MRLCTGHCLVFYIHFILQQDCVDDLSQQNSGGSGKAGKQINLWGTWWVCVVFWGNVSRLVHYNTQEMKASTPYLHSTFSNGSLWQWRVAKRDEWSKNWPQVESSKILLPFTASTHCCHASTPMSQHHQRSPSPTLTLVNCISAPAEDTSVSVHLYYHHQYDVLIEYCPSYLRYIGDLRNRNCCDTMIVQIRNQAAPSESVPKCLYRRPSWFETIS